MSRSALALSFAAILLLAAAGGIAHADPAPAYALTGTHSHTLTKGPYAPLAWESANLTSRVDGKNIYLSWSRPDTSDPVPILLDVSPYLGPSVEDSQTLVPFLKDEMESHGYAVGGIAVRGTSWSGGCIGMFGPDEMADIDQAITYIATLPWSNGSVGIYGSSYEGSTPWETAATGNPHVKAIVPMNGIPAIRDLMFHNGTAHSANGPAITSVYFGEGAARGATDGMPTQQTAAGITDAATCVDGPEGAIASEHATLTGSDDPFGYWDARDHRAAVLANYHGAVFSVMGLQDWNVDPHAQIPFAQELADHGISVRQLYHKGEHFWPDVAAMGPATMRWDWAEILLEWFDEHLKGAPASALGHAAEVESPDGTWWGLDSFPPTHATRDLLFLGADGVASTNGAPGSTMLTPQGWHGDRFTDAAGPMPVLPGSSYQADITLPTPTSVSGLARLHATVVPSGPGGDLTAWLSDVAPDGSESRLTWAQMDLAFADGGTQRHVVAPGQPLVAMMQFEPQHFVVKDGHKLRVRVWEYSAAEYFPGFVATPIALEYGAGQPSVLDLPVVPTTGAFVPPGVSTTPPRATAASYQTVQSPTAIFAVQPGESSANILIADAALPASASFHVCEDANDDGICGGAGEFDGYGCFEGTVPLHGSGTLTVTVYAETSLAPADAQGVCTFPTQLATVTGTVHATFYST